MKTTLLEGISNQKGFKLNERQAEYVNRTFQNAGGIAVFTDGQQSESVLNRNKRIAVPGDIWGISF